MLLKSHTSFWEERSMAMTSIGRREYIQQLRTRYMRASKREKGLLLREAEQFTGMHRKSVIRAIRKPWQPKRPIEPTDHQESKPLTSTDSSRRGPKCRYDHHFHDALVICWHAANDICAERLQPFLPALTARLESCGELKYTEEVGRLLRQASISTVARHLYRARRRSTIPLGTTKPGSLLKQQVAVRKGRWEETSPGWVETDTVAHGGDSGAGQFIFTYNFVDIATF